MIGICFWNMFLEETYWELLEMALFIPPNSFWRVGKHHGFRKKLLGTIGDALIIYY